MRLLFVTPYFPPYGVGGAEESTLVLARALQERGHDVRVLSLRLGPADETSAVPVERIDVGVQLTEPGRPLQPGVFERPLVQWRVARSVARAAASADVVHCQTLHLLPGAYVGARWARVPIAATIRDLTGVCSIAVCLLEQDRVPADCGLLKLQRECLPTYRKLYDVEVGPTHTVGALVRYLTARRRSAILRRCDAVVTVSRELGLLYVDAGLIAAGTPRVLPNIGTAEPMERATNRRDVAVYVGKVSHGKGVAYLLEALTLARERVPDLQLVVAGLADASWRARLLDAGVDYRGFISRPELHALYGRARFAVVPSIWPEPLPRAALETGAAGIPAVGTRVGGTPDVIEDGETGLIVPPRDADALADAIVTLWQDEELASRMGLAAQRRVASRFSAEVVAASAEDLYRRLARPRRS